MTMIKARATLSAVLLLALVQAAPALADQKEVQFLSYRNDGGYTVAQVELKWITPAGKHKSNMFTKDLAAWGDALCLDLQKFGDVEEGSEVWLKVYIAAGDNESCRKDNKRIYQPNGAIQHYKTSGQSLSNNGCKLVDHSEVRERNRGGNSLDCK